MHVILALGRQRQENCEFKATLGYIARPCSINNNKTPQTSQFVGHFGGYPKAMAKYLPFRKTPLGEETTNDLVQMVTFLFLPGRSTKVCVAVTVVFVVINFSFFFLFF
jgi:hypothetical protein